jgi:hypothetical protein
MLMTETRTSCFPTTAGKVKAFTNMPVVSTDMLSTATNHPKEFRLEQNYPNPFNPLTTIRYHLPEGAHVGMTVHNVLGQLIRTLIDQAMPSGDHSVEWDATDQSGRPVASGIYFYRMTAGEASFTRKMTLIR